MRRRTRSEGGRPREGRREWFATALLASPLLAIALAAGAWAAGPFRDVPDNHWARAAIETAVRRKLMTAQEGRFEPDRPVTRAELAVVLIRMVDAIEKAGPKPIEKSPALHDVPPAQRAALRTFPPKHWATPALARLVNGGYLSPPRDPAGWLPTPRTLDQPATAGEVARALAAVTARIEEKKVAIERPEALKEGDRPETR